MKTLPFSLVKDAIFIHLLAGWSDVAWINEYHFPCFDPTHHCLLPLLSTLLTKFIRFSLLNSPLSQYPFSLYNQVNHAVPWLMQPSHLVLLARSRGPVRKSHLLDTLVECRGRTPPTTKMTDNACDKFAFSLFRTHFVLGRCIFWHTSEMRRLISCSLKCHVTMASNYSYREKSVLF